MARSLVRLGLVLAVASWASARPAKSVPAPPDTSFSSIHEQILQPAGCAAAFCHGVDAGAGGLRLGQREQAYEELVGAPAAGDACAGLGFVRVAPGDAASSLLLLKLMADPPCGVAMPSPEALLDDPGIARIRRWIERGAPDD